MTNANNNSAAMAVNLTAGGDQSKRRALDFYPTPPDVTHALMQFLSITPGATIWEPACGDGAMAKVIESYGHRVIATDIRETGYGKGGINFLEADPQTCYAIITNPPFNLSSEFISKSLSIAPVVAMLLKSQYWHAAKRTELFEKHPPAYVLPLTWRPDFMNGERGGAPTMECIWTVWIAGDTDTRYRILRRPNSH